MLLEYRYTVTADVGQGHLVLGKLATSKELVEAEAKAVRDAFPCGNLEDCIVYSRILISGVMYTSTSYKRSTSTNDHTCPLEARTAEVVWVRTEVSQFLYLQLCQMSNILYPCNHCQQLFSYSIPHQQWHHYWSYYTAYSLHQPLKVNISKSILCFIWYRYKCINQTFVFSLHSGIRAFHTSVRYTQNMWWSKWTAPRLTSLNCLTWKGKTFEPVYTYCTYM